MKKYLILFFALVAVSGTAQDKSSFENIRSEWKSSSIDASGVGKKPSVVKLLSAFQQHWPTWMGKSIVEKASASGFKSYEDPEQSWAINYDAKSSYISLNSPENEAGSLHAITLPMNNGHTLLCVVIGTPNDEGDDIVCYYDYDPATSTMKPWDGGPDTGYSKMYEGSQTSIATPLSKDNFAFQEYFLKETEFGEIFLAERYHYKWDGERFVLDFSETTNLDLIVIQYEEWWKSMNPNAEEHPLFKKFAWVDIDHDGVPEVICSDESEKYQAVYAIGLGEPVLLAASDDKHEMTYYDRAVSSIGPTGENPDVALMTFGLMVESTVVKFLNISANISEEPLKYNFWLSNPFSEDKEEISQEHGEELTTKVGKEQDLEPKLKWRKW